MSKTYIPKSIIMTIWILKQPNILGLSSSVVKVLEW